MNIISEMTASQAKQGENSAANTETQRWPLADAERIAASVASALAPWCENIQIAGSIRRKRPTVGDIDIVILPKDAEAKASIKARCLERCKRVTDGALNFICTHPAGIQLDIFFADKAQDLLFAKEPCNWGSLLVCRTGSKEHNVLLASAAKRAGLHWAPYRGIMRGATVIASETEEAIYAAVGWPWLPPEKRDAAIMQYMRLGE